MLALIKVDKEKKNLKSRIFEEISDNDEIKCTECEFVTTDKTQLMQHMMAKHDDILWDENVEYNWDKNGMDWGQDWKDQQDFLKTPKENQKKKSVLNSKCTECSKRYVNEKQLREHMNNVHVTVYKCDICSFKANNQSQEECSLQREKV